jgi:phage shock protein PspC (stress-responsive transcriptional regulator)
MSQSTILSDRRDMTTTENDTRPQTVPTTTGTWIGKRLSRSRDQRMISGVSGGIAEYFGIDPTLVRLGFVATTFFGGAGVIGYVVAWLIIPEA